MKLLVKIAALAAVVALLGAAAKQGQELRSV